MRRPGYSQPLYMLPFDHRSSLVKKMFGWKEPLSAQQTAEIASAKDVIYAAFQAAIAGGVPKERGCILVDEQFGSGILRDASSRGFNFAYSVEKSGSDEFEFEYGAQFAEHLESFKPTFGKVLVRYNPEGDLALNQRQASRLNLLSNYLRDHTDTRFMFELLVPATASQLAQVGGDKRAYDLRVRPRLMLRAIRELQEQGVEPDVWKIEGLDERADCERMVAAAQREGRQNVSCIVLGRGESAEQVRHWVSTAAAVPGFIGFAVGRTVFWDPSRDLHEGRMTRAQAIADIAARYRSFVDLFEANRPGVHGLIEADAHP